LAKRISGRLTIGLIVTATALLTPWFFDIRGLVFEPHFVPFCRCAFPPGRLARPDQGSVDWRVIARLAATLALLTYCYTSGRILGGLLALGLVLLATTRRRLIAIIVTWVCYALTLDSDISI